MTRKLTIVWLSAILTIGVAGCAMKEGAQPAPAEKPAIQPTQPAPSVTDKAAAPAGGQAGIQEETVADRLKAPAPAPMEQPVALQPTDLRSVPFDYDQHVLSDAAMEILAANAAILKARPALRVRLEGHCDERGSDQYNIALGERRAESVRNYLASLGIAEGRLETVSYGEEKPLDPGHDESAWVKNRRVEFIPLP